MSAVFVAFLVGLVAVGLVAGLVVLAALAVAAVKALTLAHDSRAWFANRTQRRRAG